MSGWFHMGNPVPVAKLLVERVFDAQTFNLLPVLKVFAVKSIALAFQSRRDDKRVIPRYSVFLPDPQGCKINSGRGMHRQQRTEHRNQVLLRFGYTHGFSEAPESDTEEFLHDLIADNSLASIRSPANELRRLFPFGRRGVVEGIHEQICIEEKSTAHSSRPGYRGRSIEHAGAYASERRLRHRLPP